MRRMALESASAAETSLRTAWETMEAMKDCRERLDRRYVLALARLDDGSAFHQDAAVGQERDEFAAGDRQRDGAGATDGAPAGLGEVAAGSTP